MIPTTIAAIATPAGHGGIGIIRISGPLSFSIGSHLFVPRRARSPQGKSVSFPYRSHHVYFGWLQDYQQTNLIDEVLIIFMQGPKTYTCEDVVEIHCHSGHQILQSILCSVFEAGAVPAAPGEFTKRAFLNGRIDLTQAESVIDLINARSEIAREIAFSHISGQLKEKVLFFTDKLGSILAHLQASIEFPDDVEDEIDLDHIKSEITSLIIHPIEKLIANHDMSSCLTSNMRAILVGPPNVGKSSLMNLLARKQKSIVTPQPGTTRDLIEEHLPFFGAPMVLADTAGLHETDDIIETIGIGITKEQIALADLILFVVQADMPFSQNEQSICRIFKGKPVILIINKIDLVPNITPIVQPVDFPFYSCVHTSATENLGIDSLHQAITSFVNEKLSVFSDPIVPNVRQMKLLESALASLNRFIAGLSCLTPLDLLVLDLQDAMDCLDKISGNAVPLDILDRIFNEFCIGK